MGYKQKSGPLQRAGYDKNATTPFLLEETEAGTNLAAGQRDEFGTLIPEGDFSEGVTVTAKMPEQTKKAVQTLAQNLRVRQGNIVGDPSASRLKVGKATPEKVSGVTEFTISQFGGGSDKGLLSKISKAQQAAKEHRKAQKGTKL
jgi:hypothetical protein